MGLTTYTMKFSNTNNLHYSKIVGLNLSITYLYKQTHKFLIHAVLAQTKFTFYIVNYLIFIRDLFTARAGVCIKEMSFYHYSVIGFSNDAEVSFCM